MKLISDNINFIRVVGRSYLEYQSNIVVFEGQIIRRLKIYKYDGIFTKINTVWSAVISGKFGGHTTKTLLFELTDDEVYLHVDLELLAKNI